MNSYPNDDDGNALSRMANAGMNMEAVHEIEFAINSKDEETSKRIEEKLKEKGYENTEVYFDKGELEEDEEMNEGNMEFWPSWSVYVKFTIVPNYERIIQIQNDLDGVSVPLGGKSDGWGVLQN